ncbi:hypothetical protein AB0C28_01630 [Nonomuraea sp. NPDC048892]|uniref:hypothetical protein n=1 Tax=Nonomuraea sp. NPDC048892 TaxID=3154624 RepID=UPI0033E18F18
MKTSMKTRLLALACAGLVLATATAPAALAATGTSSASRSGTSDLTRSEMSSTTSSRSVTVDGRGSVVSAELLARLSAEQVEATLTEGGFPVPHRPQGADLYAVVYRTVAVDGTPTTSHRSRGRSTCAGPRCPRCSRAGSTPTAPRSTWRTGRSR